MLFGRLSCVLIGLTRIAESSTLGEWKRPPFCEDEATALRFNGLMSSSCARIDLRHQFYKPRSWALALCFIWAYFRSRSVLEEYS